jgi:hypothetical protein
MKRTIGMILGALILVTCAVDQALAAPIALFKTGGALGSGISAGDRRETRFEALLDVTLTEVAADLSIPVSPASKGRFEIFNSNSIGAFGSEVFDSGPLSFSPSSLITTYGVGTSVSLSAGAFYILAFSVVEGAIAITGRAESTQGLPFVTPEGYFRVIDGMRLGGSSSFLPAFSVAASTVPEPASMTLLMLGVVGTAMRKWRQRQDR